MEYHWNNVTGLKPWTGIWHNSLHGTLVFYNAFVKNIKNSIASFANRNVNSSCEFGKLLGTVDDIQRENWGASGNRLVLQSLNFECWFGYQVFLLDEGLLCLMNFVLLKASFNLLSLPFLFSYSHFCPVFYFLCFPVQLLFAVIFILVFPFLFLLEGGVGECICIYVGCEKGFWIVGICMRDKSF